MRLHSTNARPTRYLLYYMKYREVVVGYMYTANYGAQHVQTTHTHINHTHAACATQAGARVGAS